MDTPFSEAYRMGLSHGEREGRKLFWLGLFLGFLIGMVVIAESARGQSLLTLGENCSGELAERRACLEVEADLLHLTELRNFLTQGMVEAGGGNCGGVSCYVVLVCDQCAVDKKINGCSLVNDRVVMHRWTVLGHRIGCLLTQLRGRGLEQAVQQRALLRLDRSADIGSGDPAVIDRRREEPDR